MNISQHNKATGVKSEQRRSIPVCGMTVHRDSAAGSYEYNGKTYYFCSPHCLQKFRKDPDAFLAKPPGGATSWNSTRKVSTRRKQSNPRRPNFLTGLWTLFTPARCILRLSVTGPAAVPSAAWRLEPRTSFRSRKKRTPSSGEMSRRFWVVRGPERAAAVDRDERIHSAA